MSYADRRVEVVEAAWRVIIREGLDRASVRAIAQELGSSTGVVTHYFRDREELILFALEQIFEAILAEMKVCAEGPPSLSKLEDMIVAALPLQERDRADWKVWVAFLGYSVGRDRLVQEHRKRYDVLRHLLIQELQELQLAQFIRANLNIAVEANALISLVDGIGLDIVICPDHYSADQQRYLVRRHIQTLLKDG